MPDVSSTVRRPLMLIALGLSLAQLATGVFAAPVHAADTKQPGVSSDDAPLPTLGVRLDQTSVSGLSSGAYMAGQFQIAHADIVVGAGIIAGGPYGCAMSRSAWMFGGSRRAANLAKAVSVCMLGQLALWGYPNARQLADAAQSLMAGGAAGPRADVITDRIYVFSGTQDVLVAPSVVRATERFYKELGVPPSSIKFVSTMDAGHGFVALGAEDACQANERPYLVDCRYDQAGAMLEHIYGRLKPPATARGGRYVRFQQAPFVPRGSDAHLATHGYAYIPKACARGGCRVHMSFHGCDQNVSTIGRTMIATTGLTLWADTNRLVIVFPQVKKSSDNPQACWDWWGYTSDDFLTRKAPQIRTIRAILDHLARPVTRR